MTRKWRIALGACLLVSGGAVTGFLALGRADQPGTLVPLPPRDYEKWARAEFQRNHPGEKPLNWRLAEVAKQFHEEQPMGRFVLHKNDCSDFVACIVDEALGATARFNRDSDQHLLGEKSGLTRSWNWVPDGVVQPGDIISVRHSPWYPPRENSIWHVGVIGPEGHVYDFVKLKQWKRGRYGCNTFDWFVRHSLDPGEVRLWRLKAKYRYLIERVSSS